MDAHKKAIIAKKIERTIENLAKNKMLGFYVETKDRVVGKIKVILVGEELEY